MSEGARLFVANLSSRTNEEDLQEMFSKHGTVKSVSIREGKKNDRFAFIEMETSEGADAAIENCSGKELSGKTLRVEKAHSRGSRGGDGESRYNLGRSGGGGGGGDRSCYICKERTHVAKHCPQSNGKVGSCYLCGSKDHRMADCSKNNGSGRRRSRSRSRSRSGSRSDSSRPRGRRGRSPDRRDRRVSRRSRSKEDRRRGSPSKSRSNSRSNSRGKSPRRKDNRRRSGS